MAERICLYLDFASPYACFAFDAADRLAAPPGREIVWRLILVWPALKARGTVPAMGRPGSLRTGGVLGNDRLP
jgi:2-hydroxychromene-2-carboxylate isomerase